MERTRRQIKRKRPPGPTLALNLPLFLPHNHTHVTAPSLPPPACPASSPASSSDAGPLSLLKPIRGSSHSPPGIWGPTARPTAGVLIAPLPGMPFSDSTQLTPTHILQNLRLSPLPRRPPWLVISMLTAFSYHTFFTSCLSLEHRALTRASHHVSPASPRPGA